MCIRDRVSTAVSIMNVLYLPELYEWYRAENFDDWWINIVWTPAYCINSMTQSAKELVLDRLTNYNFDNYQSQIDVIISMIEHSNPTSGVEFANKIKSIDLIRNQDLRLAHEKIANAMGYVL